MWLRIVIFTCSCVTIVASSLPDGLVRIRRRQDEFGEVTCRFSNNWNLQPQIFSLFSCATCYHHIDQRLFYEGSKFVRRGLYLMDPKTNLTYFANISDVPEVLAGAFRTVKARQLWEECCQAADNCCKSIGRRDRDTNSSYCPRTWDGWHCWPDTPAGTTARSQCPWHVYFHTEPPECPRFATKVCHENGTWYRNEYGEWSNYTTCGRTGNIRTLLDTHIIAFAISMAFVVPALIIFLVYKELHSFRFRMHLNLFLSLLFNAVFVITFEGHYLSGSVNTGVNSFIEGNTVECKVFYTLTKYFRLCTYMWMFCEGFYLHKLIAAAFTEQKSMLLFYLIGWVFPVVPIGIWAGLRYTYADTGCWTVPYGHIEWVMSTPMLVAILANFCFLSNIIRVIVTKLGSSCYREPRRFRQTVKATVALVPLFGLHFILVMYHPRTGGCGALYVYTIITYSVDGIQGALVAFIFCYLNNEVLYLLKRSYRIRKLVRTVGSEANSKKITSFDSRFSVSTNATASDYLGRSTSK